VDNLDARAVLTKQIPQFIERHATECDSKLRRPGSEERCLREGLSEPQGIQCDDCAGNTTKCRPALTFEGGRERLMVSAVGTLEQPLPPRQPSTG
jgi:hypothetical protein